jgi:hypothetical protein
MTPPPVAGAEIRMRAIAKPSRDRHRDLGLPDEAAQVRKLRTLVPPAGLEPARLAAWDFKKSRPG